MPVSVCSQFLPSGSEGASSVRSISSTKKKKVYAGEELRTTRKTYVWISQLTKKVIS